MEQRPQYQEYLQRCQTAFFDTVKVTRGKAVSTGQLPLIMSSEVEKLKGEKLPDRDMLNDLVNSTVHHVFINQSKMLVNSLYNLIKPPAKSFLGPAYSSPGTTVAQTSQDTPLAPRPVMSPAMPSTSRMPYGMPPKLWATKNLSLGGGLNQQPA